MAIGLFLVLALASPDVLASEASSANWQIEGDVRVGLLASRRDAGSGQRSEASNARARLRVRLTGDLAPGWQLRARMAGSYASDQDRFDTYLRRYRPSATGVVPGDTTIDELHLVYTSENWQLRAGRFVTDFTLPIVPGKSLDRNDASNFGIGWTDGLHFQGRLTDAWRLHLVGQTNSRRGTGNTVRGPIDFSERGSRTSLFAALEAQEHPGPFIMRMLALTWMPDSLASAGPDQLQRDDYLTITAKSAAAWPLGDSGMRLVAAGEIGQALNRPQRQAVGLDGDSSVGGTAWQASLNLMDLRPGHHLGAVYGRLQGGWLISNDYRNNDRLAELRYQWRPSSSLSMELRYRWRGELELPESLHRTRRDQDVYARMTYRF